MAVWVRWSFSVVRQATEVGRGSISVAISVGLCRHVWGIKKSLLLLAVDKTGIHLMAAVL